MAHLHRWPRAVMAVVLVFGFAMWQPGAAAAATAEYVSYDGSGKGGQRTVRVTGGRTAQPLRAADTPQVECPPVLRCTFEPVAYVLNDPSDPTNYSNKDLANRPENGLAIKGVTLHDIEGTCEAAVDHFQDPSSFVSSTYVICADGRVIQMMPLKDVAWTARNWWYNTHFVQIEIAGYAARPGSITHAAVASAAALVRYLSAKFNFPINRATVLGHDNVPAVKTADIATQHVDPGPFFDWQGLMLRLGAPVLPEGNPFTSDMIAVAPIWPLNKQVVTGCNVSHEVPPPCVPAGGPLPANFVYLYTQPSLTSPLITDPVTGPGSTDIENRSARAFYGQKFAVADRRIETRGIWYKVWFGGQGAWLYSPYMAPTAFPARGTCAKPKGAEPVAVYGRPLPELSEWPSDFTPPPGSQTAPSPYLHTVQSGQCYAVIDAHVQASHYFSWSFGDEYPRRLITGGKEYVRVFFNGREAFLEAAKVSVS